MLHLIVDFLKFGFLVTKQTDANILIDKPNSISDVLLQRCNLFIQLVNYFLIASSSKLVVISEVVAGRLHVTFVAGLAGSLDLATIIACRCARFVRFPEFNSTPDALVSRVAHF